MVSEVTGADVLVAALDACGVDTCFTNPGTSEMHVVSAIDRHPRMRAVLGLFEGVVTGAADGYGRMSGKPACTLLHLGPGLANGLANLHNARRAGSPVVNIVGDHATYHRHLDAPLTSDIDALARPMSDWVGKPATPADIAPMTIEAVRQANSCGGRVATLILPADCAWASLPMPGLSSLVEASTQTSPLERPNLEAIATAFQQAKRPMLLLGGEGVSEESLAAAARLAAKFGIKTFAETFNRRWARGHGRLPIQPLPYLAEFAQATLSECDLLILAGARCPVAFFAYPGKPNDIMPEGLACLTLAAPGTPCSHILSDLADRLDCPGAPETSLAPSRPSLAANKSLSQDSIGQSLAALLPDNAIIVDEGCTNSFAPMHHTVNAAPHDWLQLTGGSIGCGLPLATGAATACPGQKVICIHGDGGAMYTIQALWTQARERLDVVTIVFANRAYAVLNFELARVGAGEPGAKARSMLDIGNPEIRFADLAVSMGVKGVRVDTIEAFNKVLEAALSEPGPHLIEAVI